jgi:hypothetical protein
MGKKKTTRKAGRQAETGSKLGRPSARTLILQAGDDKVKGLVAVPVLEHKILEAIEFHRRRHETTTRREILGALRNVLRAIEQEAS